MNLPVRKFACLLGRCSLFEHIRVEELEKLLRCLSPRYRKAEKSACVFMEEQEADFVGIVLSGGVHIVRHDYWGNRLIVARIGPADIFGEAFSLGNAPALPVSVVAAEKSEMLIFNSKRLLQPCATVCGFHATLIRNMIHDLARKNIMLMKKIEHITGRSTREKLLSYFSARSRQAQNKVFDIPFNRQELADYLSVDRSAMSAELGRMRNEGIIDFRKNHFELKQCHTNKK